MLYKTTCKISQAFKYSWWAKNCFIPQTPKPKSVMQINPWPQRKAGIQMHLEENQMQTGITTGLQGGNYSGMLWIFTYLTQPLSLLQTDKETFFPTTTIYFWEGCSSFNFLIQIQCVKKNKPCENSAFWHPTFHWSSSVQIQCQIQAIEILPTPT